MLPCPCYPASLMLWASWKPGWLASLGGGSASIRSCVLWLWGWPFRGWPLCGESLYRPGGSNKGHRRSLTDDGIVNTALKKLPPSSIDILVQIPSAILHHRLFHNIWKYVNVLMLTKRLKHLAFSSNFKPINVLSKLSNLVHAFGVWYNGLLLE